MPSRSSDDFVWRKYLELAERLEQVPCDECKRSAVSRAYYAAYHAAKNFLKRHQVHVPNYDHQKVWEEVKRLAAKSGVQGGRLRQSRNWADYDLDRRNAANEAKAAIVQAKDLLADLAKPSA